MMTKTTLSDGRRTRPRLAASTPTPPKFLIGTIEQSENHSTPSKQTTNPNPNGHKSRFSRPPWQNPASVMPRRFFSLVPLACPEGRRALIHPRKLSGLSQSIRCRPLAQPHPRDVGSSWRTRLPRPPWRNSRSAISGPRPLFALIPLVYPEGRRAQPHPRNELGAPSRSAAKSKPPARCRRYKNPLAQPHPRKPLVSGVLQRNVGASYASLPLVLVHPRNKQSAHARSAAPPKTPTGCQRYENPLLIVTPRLEIATTARKTNKMQNSNRYKTAVLPRRRSMRLDGRKSPPRR